VAAERSDAGRFIVHADEMLTAFIELQAAIHSQLELGWSIGKSLLTIWVKPVGVGAASQRLIPTGERSGLRTRIAATVNASLFARMKGWPPFSNSTQREKKIANKKIIWLKMSASRIVRKRASHRLRSFKRLTCNLHRFIQPMVNQYHANNDNHKKDHFKRSNDAACLALICHALSGANTLSSIRLI
jgi:hypothetical protein